jgi:signal transduction histidine kinase
MVDCKQQVQELSEAMTRLEQEHSAEIIRHHKSEMLLKNSLREQRKLAGYFRGVLEDERKSLARRIHDDLGQMLASLQLNVSLISSGYCDDQQLAAKVATVEQMIATTILTVQRISSELRPALLDQLGLAEAVDCQVEEFQKKTGISCKATILLFEKNVDIDVSTAICRILEEALINISRHSGASNVRMTLVEKKRCLTFFIGDDGRGITEDEKSDYKSFGIVRMREWANSVGGKLRTFGVERRGTLLFVRIPLAVKGSKNANQNTYSR